MGHESERRGSIEKKQKYSKKEKKNNENFFNDLSDGLPPGKSSNKSQKKENIEDIIVGVIKHLRQWGKRDVRIT